MIMNQLIAFKSSPPKRVRVPNVRFQNIHTAEPTILPSPAKKTTPSSVFRAKRRAVSCMTWRATHERGFSL